MFRFDTGMLGLILQSDMYGVSFFTFSDSIMHSKLSYFFALLHFDVQFGLNIFY